MTYSFTKEDAKFTFRYKHLIINWLDKSVRKEKKKSGDLTFIFCSDKRLLAINKQFLQHNFYTDIITFDYSQDNTISGDIFISIDRVKENALHYETTFQNELKRVMIHGVLHLCGYKDKTKAQKKQMREKEDYYLSLWPSKK